VVRQDRLDREAVELERLASASGDGPELAHRSSRGTGIPRRLSLLLNDPSRTMADIAAQCGFAHQQHFADAFRRSSGVTPTAYRERHMLRMP
jgi:AraC-like DNA-binding protein